MTHRIVGSASLEALFRNLDPPESFPVAESKERLVLLGERVAKRITVSFSDGRRQAFSSGPKRKWDDTHLPSPVRIPNDPRIDRVGPPFPTLRIRLALDPLAHLGPIAHSTLDHRAPQRHILFLGPPPARVPGGERRIEPDDGARDRVPDHARDEGPVLAPPVHGREQQGVVFGGPRFVRLVRAEVVSPETSRRSSVRLCALTKEGIVVNGVTLS